MFGKPIDQRSERNTQLRSKRLREAREKGRHTREQWEELKEEFDYRCVCCCEYFDYLTKDHIVPLYQGGSDGIENIQPLCRSCNSAKGPDNTNWAEHRRHQGWDF